MCYSPEYQPYIGKLDSDSSLSPLDNQQYLGLLDTIDNWGEPTKQQYQDLIDRIDLQSNQTKTDQDISRTNPFARQPIDSIDRDGLKPSDTNLDSLNGLLVSTSTDNTIEWDSEAFAMTDRPQEVVLRPRLEIGIGFSGGRDEDSHAFLGRFEQVAEANGWSEEVRLNQLQLNLSGSANAWFKSYHRHQGNPTWADAANELRKTFPGKDHFTLETELMNKIQGPREDLNSYYWDMKNLCERVYKGCKDSDKVLRISRGMLPRYKAMLAGRGMDNCEELEIWIREVTRLEHPSELKETNQSATTSSTNVVAPISSPAPQDAWPMPLPHYRAPEDLSNIPSYLHDSWRSKNDRYQERRNQVFDEPFASSKTDDTLKELLLDVQNMLRAMQPTAPTADNSHKEMLLEIQSTLKAMKPSSPAAEDTSKDVLLGMQNMLQGMKSAPSKVEDTSRELLLQMQNMLHGLKLDVDKIKHQPESRLNRETPFGRRSNFRERRNDPPPHRQERHGRDDRRDGPPQHVSQDTRRVHFETPPNNTWEPRRPDSPIIHPRSLSSGSPSLSRTANGQPICYFCGKVGHMQPFCPSRSTQQGNDRARR